MLYNNVDILLNWKYYFLCRICKHAWECGEMWKWDDVRVKEYDNFLEPWSEGSGTILVKSGECVNFWVLYVAMADTFTTPVG